MTDSKGAFFIALTGFSEDFLQKTRTLLEPIAGKKLSDEDCRKMTENAVALALYIRKLKEKYEL
jgi:hypothetical protein